MSDYLECTFANWPEQPWRDLLMYEMGEIGFESFTEENQVFKSYIPVSGYDQEKLKQVLSNFVDEYDSTFQTKVIPAKNWNAQWESDFQPVIIDDQCYIRANFHESKGFPYEIEITPKMSFGTGHHATTELMVRELLQMEGKGRTLMDVGCGTGVLSILAEMKGFENIFGFDNDSWALENSVENGQVNGCKNITFKKAEISELDKQSYNVILANINKNVILNDIHHYAERLAPQGELLLSGFYKQDVPDILTKSNKLGLELKKENELNNWIMLKLQKG